MSTESIREKLENYKTAPFDSRFPNQNQTRNCWQNYVDNLELNRRIVLLEYNTHTTRNLCGAKLRPRGHELFLFADYHRCEKAMAAKGGDPYVCQWYKRVYKSLCPISWVSSWDERIENGTFPGKI